MPSADNTYRRLSLRAGAAVFIISLLAYLLTMQWSVAWWDCPEYVTVASRLEVGHPPGNPVWTLAMRLATAPFPVQWHAAVINVCSAIFMALAAALLARIIFYFIIKILSVKFPTDDFNQLSLRGIVAFCASAGGALCFSLCDSAWYSAVEAEVYAMSALLTALTVWLMILWRESSDKGRRSRLLILIAYIMGLSLGVHQLNLLCIPVLFLFYAFRRYPRGGASLKIWGWVIASFAVVGCILLGLMNGTLVWSIKAELLCVNRLGLPFFSGPLAYITLLISSFILTVILLQKSRRGVATISFGIFLWLSGIFIFSDSLIAGGLAAAIAALPAGYLRVSRATLLNASWMLFFILLGFSSFSLILIRGYASPPINEAAPTDIFALKRYIQRDQYGSRPLIYGATPYSAPMLQESFLPGDSRPSYTRYVLKKKSPVFVKNRKEARLHYRSGLLSAIDSAENFRQLDRESDSYLLADYAFSQVTTPELDMWLPRITGKDANLLKSYGSWAGMTPETMTRVKVSATYDSLGNAVGKMGADGKRSRGEGLRPTYLQNFRMLMSYQIGYMYFRYLLWNFAGRQNDTHSTGEIEHGNFITGFAPIDNAMLGNQDLLPESSPYSGKSRTTLFCIPLLLGIAGIIWLSRSGRTGRRVLAIVTLLFFMTGIAIVLYLNQTPGEPRERDYSFLGSYMAFAIWIGAGFTAFSCFAMRSRSRFLTILAAIGAPLFTVALMGSQNYTSHNRGNRTDTADFASLILSMEPEGIIFTQGDNFVFPLWYAQEVEGKGKGHQVIELAYFSTPDYVVNLMRQKHPSLRFMATPEDIAYGAYALTRIAADADTTPVPLDKALRSLYSRREGRPVFTDSKVRIPGSTSDSITIDLHDVAKGGVIPFRTLMLLDVIASNSMGDNPVPLYFLSHIPASFHAALKDVEKRNAFADVYAPGISDDAWERSAHKLLSRAKASLIHEGNAPNYIDGVSDDFFRRIRGGVIRQLQHDMDTDSLYTVNFTDTLLIDRLLESYRVVPPGSFTIADSTFYEGKVFAKLALEICETKGDSARTDSIRSHIDDMNETAEKWKRYYRSLSPRQRQTVSNSTLRRLL